MRPAMLRTLFGCSGSISVVRTSLGRASTIPFQPRRNQSTLKPPSYTIDGTTYDTDSYSNTPSSILSKLPRRLHQQPSHPIGIIRRIIEDHFEGYTSVSPSTPIVTVSQNFDELGFPPDHPGRALTDSYYLNKTHMLRTHTSAHEVETYKSKLDNWLLSADVYRRDEIDKSHYPVFHQMEGTHVWPSSDLDKLVKLNEELEAKLAECPLVIEDETRISESNPYQKQHDPKHAEQIARHLKNSLNGMIFRLFGPIAMKDGEPLRIRWIEAFFPFTTPSYEVEVWWNGEWLEVLGSGVVMQKTLEQAGVPEKSGWAFGLGLERLAMVLFSIPDIRLFWSEDERFLSQFEPGKINQFKPYSKYPPCIRDMSFWIPAQGDTVDAGTTPSWHDNDYCEIVRDVAGDLIENVQLTDEFTHPKTKKRSATYRLTYRSMDRNLSNQEVNAVQAKVEERVVAEMGIQMR